MSYLQLSRYLLLACLLVWAAAMFCGLIGFASELAYFFGIISSVLLGLFAANVLVAQLIFSARSGKEAKHG